MNPGQNIKTIVVTGPESTGKTTLSKMIAEHYNAKYYPEFARSYVSNLDKPYEYFDLIKIAEHQIFDFYKFSNCNEYKYRVFDTGLIITKVWFDMVYHEVPLFLLKALKEIHVDVYLLCYPDIPWVPDGIRENGGKKRFELFERYKTEIESYNFNYVTIKGKEKERFLTSKQYIDSAHCL